MLAGRCSRFSTAIAMPPAEVHHRRVRGERRGGFFSAAFFVCLGAGLLVFGWQALTWLTKSTWKPVTVLDALNWLHIRWAVSPGNWWDWSLVTKVTLGWLSDPTGRNASKA